MTQSKQAKKKKSLKTRIRIVLAGLCAFVIGCFFYYFRVVCPIVVDLSKEKIHSVATIAVSEAVGEAMLNSKISYGDLVKMSYSDAGVIEIIEIDSVKTNLLIREVTNIVQHRFDGLSSSGIDIALGTFTGIPFLYGIGPEISVQLVPVGVIKTRLDSQFKSAGINQTLHRLNFVVSANIGMVLPAKTQNVSTDLEIMICESVIVGRIPNIYLQGNLI